MGGLLNYDQAEFEDLVGGQLSFAEVSGSTISTPRPGSNVVIAPSVNRSVISPGMDIIIHRLEVLPCAEFEVEISATLTTNDD